MTILSVCREAAVKLNQSQPSSVFSTPDALATELAFAATEAAEAILNAHDWQKLKTLATLVGDATKLAFNLPTDYDRMLKKADVHSASWQNARFSPAKDEDDWIYINDIGINATPGVWIILGGQFRVFPAMPVGETARFYYVSNLIVAPNSGANKAAFTLDSDTFRLSEKLLRLGVVWRWRSHKRMEYAEDMANFETALAEEIGKDKGSRILTVGTRRGRDAEMAYPGTITP